MRASAVERGQHGVASFRSPSTRECGERMLSSSRPIPLRRGRAMPTNEYDVQRAMEAEREAQERAAKRIAELRAKVADQTADPEARLRALLKIAASEWQRRRRKMEQGVGEADRIELTRQASDAVRRERKRQARIAAGLPFRR